MSKITIENHNDAGSFTCNFSDGSIIQYLGMLEMAKERLLARQRLSETEQEPYKYFASQEQYEGAAQRLKEIENGSPCSVDEVEHIKNGMNEWEAKLCKKELNENFNNFKNEMENLTKEQ